MESRAAATETKFKDLERKLLGDAEVTDMSELKSASTCMHDFASQLEDRLSLLEDSSTLREHAAKLERRLDALEKAKAGTASVEDSGRASSLEQMTALLVTASGLEQRLQAAAQASSERTVAQQDDSDNCMRMMTFLLDYACQLDERLAVVSGTSLTRDDQAVVEGKSRLEMMTSLLDYASQLEQRLEVLAAAPEPTPEIDDKPSKSSSMASLEAISAFSSKRTELDACAQQLRVRLSALEKRARQSPSIAEAPARPQAPAVAEVRAPLSDRDQVPRSEHEALVQAMAALKAESETLKNRHSFEAMKSEKAVQVQKAQEAQMGQLKAESEELRRQVLAAVRPDEHSAVLQRAQALAQECEALKKKEAKTPQGVSLAEHAALQRQLEMSVPASVHDALKKQLQESYQNAQEQAVLQQKLEALTKESEDLKNASKVPAAQSESYTALQQQFQSHMKVHAALCVENEQCKKKLQQASTEARAEMAQELEALRSERAALQDFAQLAADAAESTKTSAVGSGSVPSEEHEAVKAKLQQLERMSGDYNSLKKR
jgi:hypothetical protein